MDNDFESLCELASSEGWCWDLSCTTCGNMDFRYGFIELSKGKKPTSENWIVHKFTDYEEKFDRFPYEFTEDEKEAVLKICLESNLKVLREKCHFPSWLGYLGLVLSHLYTDSILYRKVSVSWATQLRDMVPLDSLIHYLLDVVINHDDTLLKLHHLEQCEYSLI